jgi:hypothetical protein
VRADVLRHVWVLRNEERTGRRRSIRVQLLPTGDGSRPMNRARSSTEECAWAPEM